MNGELKRKLYNYEASPSEEMWNKIAAALDQEIKAEFPQKLYEAEVNPPAGVWNKILTSLEEETDVEYPAKLYNLEVSPPVNAWEKIADALEQEKTFPRISSKRRMVPFVRYAVAASFLGIIAFGALKLVNRKTTDHVVAGKTVTPQSISPAIVQPDSNESSSAQTAPAISNNLPKETTALIKTTAGTKRKPTQQTGYMALLAHSSPGVTNSSALNFQQASLRIGEVPGNCPVISDGDRYLNFMNPDGYLIRISKKLAEALGCFYTNGNSEEFKQCQEQIKKWRDKIARSSATSSPDNFMDVLDIIKSVQDKEL